MVRGSERDDAAVNPYIGTVRSGRRRRRQDDKSLDGRWDRRSRKGPCSPSDVHVCLTWSHGTVIRIEEPMLSCCLANRRLQM